MGVISPPSMRGKMGGGIQLKREEAQSLMELAEPFGTRSTRLASEATFGASGPFCKLMT